MESKEFANKFTFIFGNNGVILRPKGNILGSLCVKTPLIGIFKKLKLAESNEEWRVDEFDKAKEECILTYSIRQDIDIYNEISKNDELFPHIPTFHHYETSEKTEFIIMDFIEGDYIETMILPNCTNPSLKEFDNIVCKFRNNDFDFIDRVEAIHNKEDSYKLIDLGGIIKH